MLPTHGGWKYQLLLPLIVNAYSSGYMEFHAWIGNHQTKYLSDDIDDDKALTLFNFWV